MIIGILKEQAPEKRVVLTPETAKTFISLKVEILLETGAGEFSHFSDDAYQSVGVTVTSRTNVLSRSECILTISGPLHGEFKTWGTNRMLIGFFDVFNQPSFVEQLVINKVTAFTLDLLPRTTLAQSMDARSSMATIAGYKAVLDAAQHLPRFFPMFMTASGTIKPAKVLILGAGVAGLQALATARRLGAVVEVFDVRSAVKEEVQSLGGKFIMVEGAREDMQKGGYAIEQDEAFRQRQQQMIADHAMKSDVVICTAQIPGKKAPLLLRKETVELMKPGSVIVDLAASSGGNCEVTQNDEIEIHKGVVVIGKTDYPSMMPIDASVMISNNLLNFVKPMLGPDGNSTIDWNNVIIKNTCITRSGEIINEKLNTTVKGDLTQM
jgi:NAD(P) transhydrogenase subunit alpha